MTSDDDKLSSQKPFPQKFSHNTFIVLTITLNNITLYLPQYIHCNGFAGELFVHHM